ncbi:MAG: prevent-host-death protein [Spirochaetaceae bacterium]|jgi:antitoxin (DNA-binding transcriptional repressor) of toxin-antitoxin stability system|nr:prevent-host-death protein [Spirochaetaceae bacterium]
MIAYDYGQAKENLDALLDAALKEEVIIKKSDTLVFRLAAIRQKPHNSPFDIDGITTDITTAEILDVLRECREASKNEQ